MLVISPYCGFHLLLIKMHLSNSLPLLKVTNNIKFQQFINNKIVDINDIDEDIDNIDDIISY